MPGGGVTGFTMDFEPLISSNVAIGFDCPSSSITKSSLVNPVTCSSSQPRIPSCRQGLAWRKTITGTVTNSVRTVNLGIGGDGELCWAIIAVESAMSRQAPSTVVAFSFAAQLTDFCSCILRVIAGILIEFKVHSSAIWQIVAFHRADL